MLAAWISLIAGIAGFALQGRLGAEHYYTYHNLPVIMNGVSITLFIAAFIGIF
ncbi:MAG: hypothetical protein ACI90U_000410 [Pseudomonadales bacterium]|jgi:hypothetical protein